MSVNTSAPALDAAAATGFAARRPESAPAAPQQEQVGAGDAGIGDVAANGDGQPGEPSLVLADGKRVEQRLRGMFVRAVAGVDHRAADLLAQQRHRARRRMPDDDDVGPHGVERRGGVDQRLALGHRGGRTDMLMTCAPSRLPAISKLACVRVDGSKNRLICVLPKAWAATSAPAGTPGSSPLPGRAGR